MAETMKTIVDFDKGENWAGESIALEHPFLLHGVHYETLVLRAANGLDIERYFADEKLTVPGFVKRLSDWPEDAWAHMHADDFRKIYEVGKRFLG